MPSPASPIARPSVGRTFIVAVSLLGLVALGQLTAVGWVFVHRFQTLTERAKSGPGGRLASNGTSGNAAMPGDLASTQTTEKLETTDPFAEPAGAAATSDAPILPPSKPVPLSMSKLNPAPPPPENRLQELVQQGRQLRDRGDTAAALVKFREAQTLEPGNPEPIADMAVTYERMGVMDKAAEQWKRIYEMGESAGPFFMAADARLKMSQTQALAAVQIQQQKDVANEGPISKTRADATLGIGDINQVDRNHDGITNFLLRVPIKAKRSEKISVADVDIQVFFYDQVGGKSIVQTDADLNYRFTSTPIDWATSDPEILEVEYNRQPTAAVRGARAEQRQFYGYIVRLYHKGELQDVCALPEALLKQFPAPSKLDSSTPNK
jgi:hypothetical protein